MKIIDFNEAKRKKEAKDKLRELPPYSKDLQKGFKLEHFSGSLTINDELPFVIVNIPNHYTFFRPEDGDVHFIRFNLDGYNESIPLPLKPTKIEEQEAIIYLTDRLNYILNHYNKVKFLHYFNVKYGDTTNLVSHVDKSSFIFLIFTIISGYYDMLEGMEYTLAKYNLEKDIKIRVTKAHTLYRSLEVTLGEEVVLGVNVSLGLTDTMLEKAEEIALGINEKVNLWSIVK